MTALVITEGRCFADARLIPTSYVSDGEGGGQQSETQRWNEHNGPSLEHTKLTIILPDRLNSRQGRSLTMPKRTLAPRNRFRHTKT
jgi:hypothetical protein